MYSAEKLTGNGLKSVEMLYSLPVRPSTPPSG